MHVANAETYFPLSLGSDKGQETNQITLNASFIAFTYLLSFIYLLLLLLIKQRHVFVLYHEEGKSKRASIKGVLSGGALFVSSPFSNGHLW